MQPFNIIAPPDDEDALDEDEPELDELVVDPLDPLAELVDPDALEVCPELDAFVVEPVVDVPVPVLLDVAPPAPPVPVVSSHPASNAAPTRREETEKTRAFRVRDMVRREAERPSGVTPQVQ